ncbi:MAG: hypothetical protein ACRCT1_05770 [Microcoleaceae cyanobacterium]
MLFSLFRDPSSPRFFPGARSSGYLPSETRATDDCPPHPKNTLCP